MISSIPTVVITGFGPFRSHLENSSWITVQELLKLDIKDFNIIAKELPVEYESVTKIVPDLWQKHNPEVVIHCGMSDKAKCLTVETIAHNKYYSEPDVKGNLPPGNVCCDCGPDNLCTSIDIERVVEDVNKSSIAASAEASRNAGKYLCEFIFYSSLKISTKAVFVHIPPIDQPLSAKDLAKGLAVIIRSILKQCNF